MKKQPKLTKKHLSKILNLPAFLFIAIVIIGFVAFFGRKIIISQQGSVISADSLSDEECSKVGVNGGNFPWSNEQAHQAFSAMEDLGMGWYQGIMTSKQEANKVINTINIAAEHGINIIIRACCCGFCDFDSLHGAVHTGNGTNVTDGNPEGAVNYAEILERIANSVNGREFWVQAGHNEPNGSQEHRDAVEERVFMDTLITEIRRKGLENQVHLISAALDIQYPGGQPRTFEAYIDQFENGKINSLDGMAANTYESTGGDHILERIADLKDSTGVRPIYITETAPQVMDVDLDPFKAAYKEVLADGDIAAALIFEPDNEEGYWDTNFHHITLDQVIEMLEGFGCDIRLPDDRVVDCVFDQEGLEPCKMDDNLGLARGLIMEYQDTTQTWRADWVATARIKSIPTFRYFSDIDYIGSQDTDTPSQGSSTNRLSYSCLDDICFDVTQDVVGYAQITTEYGGGVVVVGRPPYRMGAAVLLGVMGDFSDYTRSLYIPRDFIVDTENSEEAISSADIKSQHVSTRNMLSILLRSPAGDLSYYLQSRRVCREPAKIDYLYTKDEVKGFGEAPFASGTYEYDLQQMVDNSDLSGKCAAGGGCKIDTSLLACSAFASNGQITNAAGLRSCLQGLTIWVGHYIPPHGFRLGGAEEILKTYWIKVQNFAPDKDICHQTNIGIKVQIEGNMYDVGQECEEDVKNLSFNSRNCQFDEILPPGSCEELDPIANPNLEGSHKEINAYFPYFGSAVYGYSYLALQQVSIDQEDAEGSIKKVPELEDCSENPDAILCYCDDSLEVDPLAAYLFDEGFLSEQQIEIAGGRDRLKEYLSSVRNQ